MSGLVTVLVVVAVIVLIVARQIRPQRITGRGRWWPVPAVLVVLAVREPGLVDAHHHALCVLFLAAELLTGLLMGAAWAWTSRIWAEPDGSVWARGTKATVTVWTGGIALRAGLAALTALAGVHQGQGALLLTLAGSLLVRSALLLRRAQLGPVPSILGDQPAGSGAGGPAHTLRALGERRDAEDHQGRGRAREHLTLFHDGHLARLPDGQTSPAGAPMARATARESGAYGAGASGASRKDPV